MTDIAALNRLIAPEVEALGFALVRVAMIGGGSDPTLQVMAERLDTRQLGLEDCQRISRRLSDLLDSLESEGRDPIVGAYRLEVSSPGIDRPLTRLKDFDDWAGHEARLSLVAPRDNRKQYSGTLAGTDGEDIRIEVKDGQVHSLPFAEIASAKLLLTDKLINATAPISTEGADHIEEVEE
jgi:ribosome maturation factor RimP